MGRIPAPSVVSGSVSTNNTEKQVLCRKYPGKRNEIPAIVPDGQITVSNGLLMTV